MSSNVPQSVEEAAQLAEELHARMFQTEDPSAEDTLPEESNQDVELSDSEEDEDAPPIDDIKELKKFRDRYMSLKGKYDAEVPRLAAEVRELRENLNKPTKVEAPVDTSDVEEDFLTTISDEYGEDFINAIKKVIQHEVKPIIKPVQEQVQSTQNVQQEAAQDSFKKYLDSAVDKGDWRSLWEGKDPKFLDFLKEPDPSGLYNYGDLVNMYNENWDADRLAKVFNTYLATTKTTQTKVPNPQKDALIAPSRNNTQPTPNTDGKRIWTQDSFSKFQKDDRMGKYSAEESAALWDDLTSAPAEGRMR